MFVLSFMTVVPFRYLLILACEFKPHDLLVITVSVRKKDQGYSVQAMSH